MRVVIAGGTGFLGRPLSRALAADGHDVIVLTRSAPLSGQADIPGTVRAIEWTPNGDRGPWVSVIDRADAVINLAGESIAAKRWTDAQKQKILDTRVQATRSLVAAIRGASAPPHVLVSGSAVGYYGPRGSEIVTE